MVPIILSQLPIQAAPSVVSNITRSFGHFDAVIWGVVLLILFFSVAGWAVIFAKTLQFIRVKRQDRAFKHHFEQQGGKFTRIYEAAQAYPLSPCANIFAAGYLELRAIAPVQRDGSVAVRKDMLSSIQRAYEQVIARQILNLERHMIILATTVTVCPFLGLMGTVWGLLDSFWAMGAAGRGDLAVVAPGIAQALVTTVFGLAAAIPAVVAYNAFQNRINEVILEMDEFSGRNVSILERNVGQDRSAAPARPLEAWAEPR